MTDPKEIAARIVQQFTGYIEHPLPGVFRLQGLITEAISVRDAEHAENLRCCPKASHIHDLPLPESCPACEVLELRAAQRELLGALREVLKEYDLGFKISTLNLQFYRAMLAKYPEAAQTTNLKGEKDGNT